jgi:hypothetical protein
VHYALHSRFLLGDTGYTEEQRNSIPPATWPLVQTDPRSGRKILFVGVHACEVQGMTLAEGRMLLMDLLEHATQRQFVYQHHWQVGDLVMWDNTATVHRGRWFDFANGASCAGRPPRKCRPEPAKRSPWRWLACGDGRLPPHRAHPRHGSRHRPDPRSLRTPLAAGAAA